MRTKLVMSYAVLPGPVKPGVFELYTMSKDPPDRPLGIPDSLLEDLLIPLSQPFEIASVQIAQSGTINIIARSTVSDKSFEAGDQVNKIKTRRVGNRAGFDNTYRKRFSLAGCMLRGVKFLSLIEKTEPREPVVFTAA